MRVVVLALLLLSAGCPPDHDAPRLDARMAFADGVIAYGSTRDAVLRAHERTRRALGPDPAISDPSPVDAAPLRALVASWSSDASASSR